MTRLTGMLATLALVLGVTMAVPLAGPAAAQALGLGRARLLFRHVLPNVAPSIVIVASLQFAQFIVAEAAISFLGFGVQPPTPAWGSMLSESRDYLYVAWWLAAFPGAALALTALGINLVGDWLRDVLDPRFRV